MLRLASFTLFALGSLGCLFHGSVGAQVGNCEPLREQIAARIQAGGVPNVQLVVVDVAASAPGRVVGRCERGTRKIVQLGAGAAAASAPKASRPGDEALLTECKDGRVQRGGSCRK